MHLVVGPFGHPTWWTTTAARLDAWTAKGVVPGTTDPKGDGLCAIFTRNSVSELSAVDSGTLDPTMAGGSWETPTFGAAGNVEVGGADTLTLIAAPVLCFAAGHRHGSYDGRCHDCRRYRHGGHSHMTSRRPVYKYSTW